MLFISACFFTFASFAFGNSVDSFYPNLKNPEVISERTYNALMYGNKYETRTDATDGSYSYCSMPHPSTNFYQEPQIIKNGSVSANLSSLLYIQRHQKRTMYHIFPQGETTKYDCHESRPYVYIGSANNSHPMPVPVFAKSYASNGNPLSDAFTNGSCQFPQLTMGCYLDGVQHGTELRKLYGEKYCVIPKDPNTKGVYLRSSTAPLTQDSAGGVLRGLWPNYHGSLPLHQQISQIDTHEPSCDRKDALLKASKETTLWKKHLNITQGLRKELERMLLTNSSDWQSDWDHYNDNFQARLCNGYSLPCSTTSNDCVSEKQANEVFTAGDWEYNYYWVTRENVTEAIKFTSGLFIKDLIELLKDMADSSKDLRYAHLFMHDGDLGPLAGSLGIQTLRWPGMGSNIAIELWKTDNDKHFVRALYSGWPIRSTLADLDWIELDEFLKKWGQFIPNDYVDECAKGL